MSTKESSDVGRIMFHDEGDDKSPKEEFPHFGAEGARRFGSLVARWHSGGSQQREADQMIRFGRNVKQARLDIHLTVGQLAERCGLDADLLFYLERGATSSAEVAGMLDKLVAGLGIPLAELMQGFPVSGRHSIDQPERGNISPNYDERKTLHEP